MIESTEVITDPERFQRVTYDLMIAGKGKRLGMTKPSVFYLWDGKVYGVSIAFGEVRVYDREAFAKAVQAETFPGYISCD